MSIELASAFITIVPSLKGAGGQITSELSGVDMTGVGSKLGAELGSSIGRSLDLQTVGTRIQDIGGMITDVGSSMTKNVTAPAVIAAGAVGGVVAAFGWGRLTSLDAAQAQLRGLGYEAEDVARISEMVNEAVTGGMATMGQGTSVAAGALAAGVAEGDDLIRFIQLVDAAAAGAQRPIGDMAMVFNRVQGMGTLMTGELNMIEDGLPGFTAAMAEASGVTIGEFREMVTAGEITSDQFLDVMDGFAGDMATEYAKSWDGMVGNTKAWVGIIGETILGGVFEQSKDELAAFQEWLKTDEVQAWAADFGKTVGDAFTGLLNAIKGVIEWWGNLDPGMQSFLLGLLGAAIAIGPILIVVGKVAAGIGAVVKVIGILMPIIRGISLAFSAFNLILAANPLILIAMLVIALVGAMIYFFTQTELGQEIWANFTQFLSEAWTNITTFLSEAWANITQWFTEFGTNISTGWNDLWTGVGDFFSGIWEGIKTAFNAALEWLIDLFLNWTLLGLIIQHWDSIVQVFTDVWNNIKTFVSDAINNVSTTISNVLDGIKTTWTDTWNNVFSFVSDIWSNITTGISDGWNGVADFLGSIPGKVKDFFSGIGTWLIDSGKSLLTGFIEGITSGFDNAMGAIGDGLTAIRDFFPFSPAKDGPFSGKGWVAFAGESVGETFLDSMAVGMKSNISDVRAGLSTVRREFDQTVGNRGFTAQVNADRFEAAGGGDQRPVQVIVQALPGMSEETIGGMAARKMSQILRG